MKSKSAYILLIVFWGLISAQTRLNAGENALRCEIFGKVMDVNGDEALPFASVQILNIPDSSLFAGTMADADGNYKLLNIPSGQYVLVASYMGYENKMQLVKLDKRSLKQDFYLALIGISLSEVSVEAEMNRVQTGIEKITLNVASDITLTGGTAVDVMQTLPSVDIDYDGKVNYRGSDKVNVLINGERSELVKSLDQIPADQIEKIEIIGNPSARYDAEGMAGIINIILKKNVSGKRKTSLQVNTGCPETYGGNFGYTQSGMKSSFFVNAGLKHNTKFQTKEHLRVNYENPEAFNYSQFDRQDQSLNNAMLNTGFNFRPSEKQSFGASLIASGTMNTADRSIEYETLGYDASRRYVSQKDIFIHLNNYKLDGKLHHQLSLKSGRSLRTKVSYSILDQMQEMENSHYHSEINDPELQNTFAKQENKLGSFALDYSHPLGDSLLFEGGYNFSFRDLLNDFSAEFYQDNIWESDTSINNRFNFLQQKHASYVNAVWTMNFMTVQAGIRAEYTMDKQNAIETANYLDWFPSLNLSRKTSERNTVYLAATRRINRPSIKMLNPYSDEYADLLNMHKGNPDLNPEYVNSLEFGNRFVNESYSVMGSVYYRHIDQAISRIKSASNDSALYVSFINLDYARMTGADLSLTYKPVKWWTLGADASLFATSLFGESENNQIDKEKLAWNGSLVNKFKFRQGFAFQVSANYRSKLPSVMGVYKERYYCDLALSKSMMKNKGRLVFRVSDVFNTYLFGLDLDAEDVNGYRYSQSNRRKNESRYFILSFVYNINGGDKIQKNGKGNFFLNAFDK